MGTLDNARRSILTALAGIALTAGWSCTERALAVSRDYTIDMNQSSIAISGTVYSADLNQTRSIVEQGAGSLTTKYTGTFKTNRVTNSISFLSGSTIDASVNGSWQPMADASAGSAPADYGGRANFTVTIIIPVTVPVYFAGRDLAADVASGPLTINASNQFSLAGTNLTFTGGGIAYRASTGDPAGTASIVGEGGTLSGTGTLATLSQGGAVYETLSVPVNSTFQFGDASATINLTLTGQIYATYLIPSSNGDYNQNGTVDAADYAVWRDTMGQAGVGLAADGNGNNQIDSGDFNVWRSKFGQMLLGSGSGGEWSHALAVPEPLSLILLGAGALFSRVRCRRAVAQ